MNSSTFVQATADVVRVVNLKQGDVYKRFDNPSYGAPELVFGIVQDILNNGTRTVITAVEYNALGTSVEAKVRMFGDGTDLQLFPATPEEISAHLLEVLKAADYGVKRAAEKLQEAQASHAALQVTYHRLSSGELTATEVERPALQG